MAQSNVPKSGVPKTYGQMINPNDPPSRSKMPQFGAREEGEGGAYTAYFENARKTKNDGPMLDQVELQLNQDINNRAQPPSPAGGTKNRIDDQHQLRNASRGSNSSVATSESAMRHGRQNKEQASGGGSSLRFTASVAETEPIHEGSKLLQLSKAPKFSAWEGGENSTIYSDDARKKKTNGQLINPNDPQARSKVLEFGTWQQDEGEAAYTQSFENVMKNKRIGCTVTTEPSDPTPGSPAKVGCSKVPQFGVWEAVERGDWDSGNIFVGDSYSLTEPSNMYNYNDMLDEVESAVMLDDFEAAEPLNMARFPLVNLDFLPERTLHSARSDNELAYGGGGRLGFENSDGQPWNMARSPLVNLDMMNERSPKPARADDELAYGGGGRLKFKIRDRKIDGELKNAALTTGFSASLAHPESVQKEPKLFQDPGMTLNNDMKCEGHRQLPPEDSQLLPESTGHSNNKNDGHSKIAPRGFQASAVGSKAPVRKETKILKSTSNDNPASDHLSYRESNHKEKKMGSCLPWLRRGMKHRLLKQSCSEKDSCI